MELLLATLFFIVALLYSAVGLGGGTGYLAAMSLVGVDPAIMRTVALSMNVLVASLSSWQYIRSGYFSARIFWPLILASVPFAFLGGYLELPGDVYRALVGLLLLYSAARLWLSSMESRKLPEVRADLPVWVFLISGAVIGLVSGLVGMGGGILLGPLLLLSGWADTKDALGITAAFVLGNSIAALAGRLTAVPVLPHNIWFWILAAGIGGYLGSRLGSRRLNPRILRRILAIILLVAGLRLVISAF